MISIVLFKRSNSCFSNLGIHSSHTFGLSRLSVFLVVQHAYIQRLAHVFGIRWHICVLLGGVQTYVGLYDVFWEIGRQVITNNQFLVLKSSTIWTILTGWLAIGVDVHLMTSLNNWAREFELTPSERGAKSSLRMKHIKNKVVGSLL